MGFSHLNHVADAKTATLGIVAPDGRDGMQKHARDLAAAGVPFIFDPGQGLPMFSGDDLMNFMKLADYACFNDYEAKMLADRTGCSIEKLATEVKALIVTRGGEGSQIHANGQRYEIPCVKADEVVDPTGCGDAYRAGLLFGISAGWDWEKTGRLAAVMGAIKIAHRGGQNHRPSLGEISERFTSAFGSAPW
jgi:adenosine kinase